MSVEIGQMRHAFPGEIGGLNQRRHSRILIKKGQMMSSILRANCAHVQSEHASALSGFPYYSSSKILNVHPIIWIFRGNFWKMNRLVRKNQRADEFALTPEIF